MVVTAIVDEGLGNSSYVVDLGDGGGMVVDPERDPRPYLRELERARLRPRFVVETHLHADFVSGSRELIAEGAMLLAPAGSQAAFPHRPLNDGEQVDLGGLTLEVIATPGHTPEHLSYLVSDDSDQIGLFSGGTLMAGGVARTDLLSPDQTEPLARAAYRSIRQRLFTLRDELVVYPTHGAGSFCSVGGGTERTTTIGAERISNPLIAGEVDEDTFVRRLLAGYGSYPPYFLELRPLNRRGPRVFGTSPSPLPRLSVADLEAAMADGADVIDVRSIDAFAAGHVPGSVSNPWRKSFSTWLGWLMTLDKRLVFVTDNTVDEQNLIWSALTVGFENLTGLLAGGMPAWIEAGRPVSRIEIAQDPAAVGHRSILDVRQESEYQTGHHPDAVHVELGSVIDSTTELPPGELLLHCGHGERAMTAASLLAKAGRQNVVVFGGGHDQLRSQVAGS